MKMSQNNECLLNNFLEEDFQQMLRPYYVTQKLLCASKYSIKDNFVLPNSKAYCVVVVFALCFITYTYLTVSLDKPCTIGNQCPLISDVYYLLAHFITAACVIAQTESVVRLLIIMQSVDRKLKSFSIPKLPYFVTRNWCSVFFLSLLFGAGFWMTARNTDHFPWTVYLTIFLSSILDLDMLYAICIVEFLSSRLGRFSILFSNYVKNPLNMSLENNLSSTFKKLFQIPQETFEAFILSNSLVQYPVLSYFISTFSSALVSLQITIEWTKTGQISVIYKDVSVIHIFSLVWNLKNFVLILMFSVSYERFYRCVDDMKDSCVLLFESSSEKCISRKTAKNILRLCEVKLCKMRVCDLFCVDGALPLRLAGLIATYCIVLLQFAFL